MKLGSDTLAAHLARQLLPAYLVSGDEPLLLGEAADAIRAAARAAGYTDRQVFFAERGFDWNELRGESQSLSLFAQRRILEIKLPSGKPGDDGAQLLQEMVERPGPDQLLLVISGQLERAALNSEWLKAFERQGAWITVWPVDIGKLPAWIAGRMKRHGMTPEPAAAELLAQRVEGNLLAAQQEIDKLALLHGPGRIDATTLEDSVAKSARYDVYKLPEAAMRGDADRALRILGGLQDEGEEATLVLWVLSSSLRALWNASRGLPPPNYPRPPAALPDAVRRIRLPAIVQLVSDAAAIDRTIKGRAAGDPWDGLARLVAQLAGLRLAPLST